MPSASGILLLPPAQDPFDRRAAHHHAQHLDAEVVLGDVQRAHVAERVADHPGTGLPHDVELAGVLDPRHAAPAVLIAPVGSELELGRTPAALVGCVELFDVHACLSPVTLRVDEPGEEIGQDTCGRAPDRLVGELEEEHRHVGAERVPALLPVERGVHQLRQRHLEHPHHLGGVRNELGRASEEAHERGDREARRGRRHPAEPGHDLDRRRVRDRSPRAPRAAPRRGRRRRPRDRACRPGRRSRPGGSASSPVA